MSDEPLIALLETHLARYPAAELLDIYKLLHQATFGPGHAISSRKITQEWLEYELSASGDPAGEPLIETIHPAGEIVRVYMRPYAAQGGNIKRYMDAFVRSARQVEGDPAIMAQRWAIFETLCRANPGCSARFGKREVSMMGQVRASEEWPAVHHSPAYHATYDPHYRVLARAEAEKLFQRENLPFEVV